MKKFHCSHCKKGVEILLRPDYSSSGMWCTNCGIMITQEQLTKIPAEYFDMIDMWAWFWDFGMHNGNMINKYYFEQLVDQNGYTISKIISKYYPCVYFDFSKVYLK